MLGCRRVRDSGPSMGPRAPEPAGTMHLALTDRLTCPRCGPDFGLILLAHVVRDQRVYEGEFGCSNCRDRYPVHGGFGDLRPRPRSPLNPDHPDSHPEDPDSEEAVKMAALLGVTEGPGTLFLRGPRARYASRISKMIKGVEVVGAHPDLAALGDVEGVSRVATGLGIPFYSASFRGVLLSGGIEKGDMAEGARAVAPGGRVVVMDGPEASAGWAEAAGLKVLLEEDGVVVGVREQAASGPLVTLRGF